MTKKGVTTYQVYTYQGVNFRKITIPRDVALDSSFPFNPGDKLSVEIDVANQSLVIKKLGE